MKVIRQVNEYQLYTNELLNMYAISDNEEVSLWFDSYTKEDLISLNNEDFIKECKELLK